MPNRTPVPKPLQPVIGLIIGGFFAGSALLSVAHSIEARRWPTTSGTVKSERLHLGYRRSTRRHRRNTYQPTLHYSYAVNGKKHDGKRVRYGYWGLGLRLGRWVGYKHPVERKFPKGSRVAVRYDPDDPGNSVLLAKLPGPLNFFVMMLGAIVIWASVSPKSLKALAKHKHKHRYKKKKKSKRKREYAIH